MGKTNSEIDPNDPDQFGLDAYGRMPPIMIDSGAFSAFHQKKEIELQKYIDFIHKILIGHKKIVYVNLDVIGNGERSYNNYLEMRKQGLEPLPIFHTNTDTKWLEKYLAITDYVGLGLVGTGKGENRARALDPVFQKYLVDDGGMPTVKVHGMGVTSFGHIARYPWYSIDSTTFLKRAQFGQITVPVFRNGDWCWNERPRIITITPEKSAAIMTKGEHITNVSPHYKKIIMRFLEEFGFEFGESRFEKGEEVVIKQGLVNFQEARRLENAFVFARFVSEFPYPRKFTANRIRGLLV